jgi:DNA-binding NarL/FixJ family response regulator
VLVEAFGRAGAVVEMAPGSGTGTDAARAALVDHLSTVVPDVAVVGTDLGERVVGLVAALDERVPVLPVLALADPGSEELVDRAVLAGLRAVIPTEAGAAAVVAAAERTARGEAPLTPAAASGVLAAYRRLVEDPGSGVAGTPTLTPTEQEVLQRLAAGATPDRIASLHQVTPRMVLLPVAAAVRKLQRAHRDARLRGR